MASHPTDVHSKALAINLEQSIYGTFAEIGTGREVARWYFGVGAASGTVAQTISAYDKTVAPQATRQTWYPNSFLVPIANNEPWLSSALELVGSIVEKLGHAGVPTTKVVILGCSQGAYLATEFVARNLERYGETWEQN